MSVEQAHNSTSTHIIRIMLRTFPWRSPLILCRRPDQWQDNASIILLQINKRFQTNAADTSDHMTRTAFYSRLMTYWRLQLFPNNGAFWVSSPGRARLFQYGKWRRHSDLQMCDWFMTSLKRTHVAAKFPMSAPSKYNEMKPSCINV